MCNLKHLFLFSCHLWRANLPVSVSVDCSLIVDIFLTWLANFCCELILSRSALFLGREFSVLWDGKMLL